MVTYLPMFLRENGASNVVIGLIPGIYALTRAFTGLLAAPYVDRARTRRTSYPTRPAIRSPFRR